MLKFVWLISAPKNAIKTLSRHVWMFLIKIDTPYCSGGGGGGGGDGGDGGSFFNALCNISVVRK